MKDGNATMEVNDFTYNYKLALGQIRKNIRNNNAVPGGYSCSETTADKSNLAADKLKNEADINEDSTSKALTDIIKNSHTESSDETKTVIYPQPSSTLGRESSSKKESTGHSQYKREEYNFYVAASDKELIEKLTSILRSRGYVGYADGGGKMHYLVDGRHNLYKSADSILSILAESESSNYYRHNAELIEKQNTAIEIVLKRNNIPNNLKGYTYLSAILSELLNSGGKLNTADKAIYVKIAERFDTGRKQVDRVVSYAFQKAGLTGSNSMLISKLYAEVKREYMKLLHENKDSN